MSPGFVAADVMSPTHNAFGVIGGLNIVDFDSNGNAVALAGSVTVDDTGFNPIPEPATLTLFGIGLAGLARIRWCRQLR